MTIWIALLRGINVGKKNRIKMAPLRDALEEAGCSEVQSYLQSGNLVFSSTSRSAKKVGELVGHVLRTGFGIETPVMILNATELRAAAEKNPFPEAESSPKTLHLWFLSQKPKAVDHETLNGLKTDTERYVSKGEVFYLNAPDGIGRSKLAAKVERIVGEGTARNWRTVSALLDLLDS